jgi:hypothetical protein
MAEGWLNGDGIWISFDGDVILAAIGLCEFFQWHATEYHHFGRAVRNARDTHLVLMECKFHRGINPISDKVSFSSPNRSSLPSSSLTLAFSSMFSASKVDTVLSRAACD